MVATPGQIGGTRMGTQQKTQQPTQKTHQSNQTKDQMGGTSQVGTHANPAGTQDPRQDQAWQDPATRAKQQGDRTDKAMPSGTTPLERDQRPLNEQR
jgi:hypothetical protein